MDYIHIFLIDPGSVGEILWMMMWAVEAGDPLYPGNNYSGISNYYTLVTTQILAIGKTTQFFFD